MTDWTTRLFPAPGKTKEVILKSILQGAHIQWYVATSLGYFWTLLEPEGTKKETERTRKNQQKPTRTKKNHEEPKRNRESRKEQKEPEPERTRKNKKLKKK